MLVGKSLGKIFVKLLVKVNRHFIKFAVTHRTHISSQLILIIGAKAIITKNHDEHNIIKEKFYIVAPN